MNSWRIPRKFLTLLLPLLLCVACSSSQKNAKPEKRLLIIVSDVRNGTGDKSYDSIGDESTSEYINELIKTDTFRIIERQRLSDILKEMNLNMTGLVDSSKMKQVGKVLGADAIVFVELSAAQHTSDTKRLGNSERVSEVLNPGISTRIVDIETGEILASAAITHSYTNSFTKLGELVNTGSAMDKLSFVKKSLSLAAPNLCENLSKQIKKYYKRRQ